MESRISMITLGVRDVARATRFYQDGLGLRRLEHPSEDARFFDLDGTWLGLFPWDKLAEDAEVVATGEGFRGVTLGYNVRSPEAVDAALAEAVAAGATLRKNGQEVFWGGYSGYFEDPEGHLWEVAHNPFMWVGPGEA